jgi:hypothetical protein
MSFVQTLKSLFVKPPASVAEVLSAPAVPAAKPITPNLSPAATTASPDGQNNQARRFVIEQKQYIFGLAWRLLPPTRTLARTLKLAKQEGMAFHVLSEMEDLIGVTTAMPKTRGPKYSAAMHLATKMSQGGLELYAFALPKGAYAVVAINESRPIPGFDFVGPFAPAKELIDEFQAIQAGHPVRGVGNAGLIEGEEHIEPEDIFGEPAKQARIKAMPGTRSTTWLIGLAVLLALGFAGAMYWLQEQRKDVLEEVKREDANPVLEYRNSLQNALKALPPAGPRMLKDWLHTIDQLPVVNHGWRLNKVECNPSSCNAQWERVFGSYTDFHSHLPPFTDSVKEVQAGADPLQASILTTHKLPLSAVTSAPVAAPLLQYSGLPTQQIGLRELSTQFQELSLLGPMKVSLTPPQLFGGSGNVNQVKEVVASGDWAIEHELWVLPEIKITPYMVTKSLVMNFATDKGQTKTTYRLEGSYYVQQH